MNTSTLPLASLLHEPSDSTFLTCTSVCSSTNTFHDETIVKPVPNRQSIAFLLEKQSNPKRPTAGPSETINDAAAVLSSLGNKGDLQNADPPSRHRSTASFWETVLGPSNCVSQESHRQTGRIEKSSFRCACGVSFRQRSAMHAHFRGVHMQQRPFSCDFPSCKARYKYKGDLVRSSLS